MASGVDVDESVAALWDDMKTRHKYKYITFKIIDSKKIGVATTETDFSVTVDDFVKRECDPSVCFYAVFDHHFEKKGADGGSDGKREKLVFISWAPDTAKVKEKMLHSSSKEALKKKLAGFAKALQVTEKSEINAEILTDLFK